MPVSTLRTGRGGKAFLVENDTRSATSSGKLKIRKVFGFGSAQTAVVLSYRSALAPSVFVPFVDRPLRFLRFCDFWKFLQ